MIRVKIKTRDPKELIGNVYACDNIEFITLRIEGDGIKFAVLDGWEGGKKSSASKISFETFYKALKARQYKYVRKYEGDLT